MDQSQQAAPDTIDLKQLLSVLNAYKKGDFTARMPVDLAGVSGKIADTLDQIIDMAEQTTVEYARVAKAVGRQGRIDQRIDVVGARGGWAQQNISSNSIINDLVSPMSEMIHVIGAVSEGDLSQIVPMDIEGVKLQGQTLKSAKIINTMVFRLSAYSSEVTRVAREVGLEGKLGGQAKVKDLAGEWKNSTESVNLMVTNLTNQVRNIAEVSTAVTKGDLSKRVTVDSNGELLELKIANNLMVEQLSTFASEVARVAREVGIEGKLGGQAQVKGVAGEWKDLTDNVNLMVTNLTNQVRNIADVATAVTKGDLSQKITVDVKGEILQVKDVINTMVGQLGLFTSEVTRVAREVGTDGKLGGQALVPGVAGTWKDLTDNVNAMAGNLTVQLRDVSKVATAIAKGDLSQKITVDVKGEILQIKDVINTMVDQLGLFTSEVTRVAREVGTDGKLGGQALVPGVAGTWKDLTDNVNAMAGNLTVQLRDVSKVATAIAKGDLSQKITVDVKGEILQIKDVINTMVGLLGSFASEVTRVAREVGTDGKLGGQADVKDVAGIWKDLTDNVNAMAGNLTVQLRDVSKVATAISKGDLSQKITVDVKGEILQIKDVINTMVDQLGLFTSEVTRVAREVGTDGKLGGQADVKDVAGIWKDLTDNVNAMAGNLTVQLRDVSKVATAIASGDLSQKITVNVKGEILQIKDVINTMVGLLGSFASEVTRVAREVGTDGKLGGQADVKNVAGIWKDLTDNVNGLAGNLTSQVRAIGDVATAVTKGDLTRNVQVEAQGEVADLKDNINKMIRNLRETTQVNSEQDWLKTNLAKFTRMLQGQRDLGAVSKMVLSELAPLINSQRGVFYIMDETAAENPHLKLLSSYAFKERKNVSSQWGLGEGLVGQCALEKQRILLTNVPSDYIEITSGLGESTPQNIVVLPILFENKVKAVIEVASFTLFSEIHQNFLDQLSESIGIVLNTIEANMRTEELLKESQSLAGELGSQQEELRQTNEELEEKAHLLEDQKIEVEHKNSEVESAKELLEEKAEQLSLTSKYKSEFLSNMSHELRTPLNSLLILSQQLADNPEHNLDPKQVEYAKTIQASGKDLLALINEILDLSKIESGTVTMELEHVPFSNIRNQIDRTFRHVADSRQLNFDITLSPELSDTMYTDEKRLQQVMKNLLSNSFKFTEKGGVTVRIEPVDSGWSADHPILDRTESVVGFYITDTGIGVPVDKQRSIFEAFQQADAGTSRKFGGTGLGLSISREIARLLDGELRMIESKLGKGSTFALFLPLQASDSDNPDLTTADSKINNATEVAKSFVSNVGKAVATGTTKHSIVADDRESIEPGDRTLLIIEDDVSFADILLQAAREKGFKGIVTTLGNEGIELAEKYHPTAITLDLHLPDTDGWAVLDSFKRNPDLRHIPVEIISSDDSRSRGLRFGAFEFLVKPVTLEAIKTALTDVTQFAELKVKELLIADGSEEQRKDIVTLIGNGDDVHIEEVSTGKAALAALKNKRYDCMVLDFNLPDMEGLKLIETIHSNAWTSEMPVIMYGAKDLPENQQALLKSLELKCILKNVQSPEHLLKESALFLHRVVSNLPDDRRQMLEKLHASGDILVGKKVLVVDDDVRNIFALTAALERNKIEVLSAESGKDAIELLKKNPLIDAVLMDIMMPDMDGYEAMQRIRKIKKFDTLPMIALTAKAMKGDREKCIEAGASDYVSKPVDVDQLLSLLRVWLYR
jgi:signal transduction histidine kinase/DNA-binding response OmpR family regulator/HAMP domain-containing protein